MLKKALAAVIALLLALMLVPIGRMMLRELVMNGPNSLSSDEGLALAVLLTLIISVFAFGAFLLHRREAATDHISDETASA